MRTGRFEGPGDKFVLVGQSAAIQQVVNLVDAVAQSDCSVLIEGESGTGKELIARRLHAKSRRNGRPFIPVNCAGVSETLFESQFFGHIRGSFTGAEQTMLGLVRSAHEGTLFMDEIGEVPLSLQPKLLRVLQDNEVMPVGANAPVTADVRFVAATNRSLRQDIDEGRFREDLFYRLNIVRIHVPPLRERPEDISVLLDHFLAKCAAKYAKPVIPVSGAVRAALSQHRWRGNIRELVNWVERLYATGLPADLLAESLLAEAEPQARPPQKVMSLQEAERRAIVCALEATHHNQKEAARLLQTHRTTLFRKLRDHSLP